jgi:3D (Asp-Asp-Asp) domain-containing protein
MRIIKVILVLLFLIPLSTGMVPSKSEPKVNLVNNVYDKVIKQFVTLTTYSPTESETDSTPNITASGFKINLDNPSKHRIIAVSRDLKRKGWKFGKKVKIKGAGKYNGVYTIRDLMNKRHKNRIDILIDEEQKPIKLKNIEVTLLK